MLATRHVYSHSYPSESMADVEIQGARRSPEHGANWCEYAHLAEREGDYHLVFVRTSGTRSGLLLTNTYYADPYIVVAVQLSDGQYMFFSSKAPDSEGGLLQLDVFDDASPNQRMQAD